MMLSASVFLGHSLYLIICMRVSISRIHITVNFRNERKEVSCVIPPLYHYDHIILGIRLIIPRHLHHRMLHERHNCHCHYHRWTLEAARGVAQARTG